MDIPDTHEEAHRVLSEFERRHWASLPEAVQNVIDANRAGSNVDLFARTAESLYANRAQLKNKASLELAAKLAGFCHAHGFQHLRGDRGRTISRALRREAGETAPEGIVWPDPKDDPQPLAEYAPATAPAEA